MFLIKLQNVHTNIYFVGYCHLFYLYDYNIQLTIPTSHKTNLIKYLNQ